MRGARPTVAPAPTLPLPTHGFWPRRRPPRCAPLSRPGYPSKLDRHAAYWAHRYLQNLAQIRYSDMIGDISAHSRRWEARGAAAVAALRDAKADGRRYGAVGLEPQMRSYPRLHPQPVRTTANLHHTLEAPHERVRP